MYRLERTSEACPEQYDVYRRSGGEEVLIGYLHLREKLFKACVLFGPQGEVVRQVYTKRVKPEAYGGWPEGDPERAQELATGLRAITEFVGGNNNL